MVVYGGESVILVVGAVGGVDDEQELLVGGGGGAVPEVTPSHGMADLVSYGNEERDFEQKLGKKKRKAGSNSCAPEGTDPLPKFNMESFDMNWEVEQDISV